MQQILWTQQLASIIVCADLWNRHVGRTMDQPEDSSSTVGNLSRPTASNLSRRKLLAMGLGALPLGLLLRGQASAQGFSQAPLVPKDAQSDPQHRFWKDLRGEFPTEPGHVHFDMAGLGTPPFTALDAMQRADRQAAGTGNGLDATWGAKLRTRLASFLNTKAESLFLASDDASAMGRVADALPIRRGSRVVLASHEAPASLAPWVSLAREGRIDIRFVDVHEEASTTVKRVRAQLDTGSVLVMPHVLPTTGTVLPIADLAELARNRRGTIVVQGSQAIGMQKIDLEALGVDVYVAATHNWLMGPVGVAFAYIKPELHPALTPRPALVDVRTPEYVVQRHHQVESLQELETSPTNAGLVAGTMASIDWVADFGITPSRNYATALAAQLQDGLEALDGIDVLTTPKSALAMPVVAFRVPRRPNTQVASWLQEEMGIRVHRLDSQNLNAVRASTSIVNKPADIQWLLKGAKALV